MQKLKNTWSKIKLWSLRKKIIYGLITIFVIFSIIMFVKPKDNSENIITEKAKIIDLKQTVLATGQVTSNTDLNLSFFSSGIVRSVRAKVGDIVKQGQILATLDQGNEGAALTQARGALAAAEARYKSILDGASSEEINLAKVALSNAESAAENAYNAMLSNGLIAIPLNTTTNTTYNAPTISGTYTGKIEGEYIITIIPGTSPYFNTTGIETSTGPISSSTPVKLGTKGLYIQFPINFADTNSNTQWVVSIPNTKSSTYITYYNNYQSALKLIEQREAELTLKQATARQADIELAKANILTAEGQLESASANFEHTILRAPAEGTITSVDIKIGELAQALKEAMKLQNIKNIYLEANINEANINSVKMGASVDITFDAFGEEQTYKGNIIEIDPSSTIVSGVVNYKIKASVLNAPELRPGMTANMTILSDERANALVIPTRAIVKKENGEKIVRLITDTKKKTFVEVNIISGIDGDEGMSQITSGLKDGDEVVVLIKK